MLETDVFQSVLQSIVIKIEVACLSGGLFHAIFTFFEQKKSKKICRNNNKYLTLHPKSIRMYRTFPNEDIFLICFSR